MRQLTFPGFMEKYVSSLSDSNTCAVYSLVREATVSNFRLREPLYLYALSNGKMKTLLNASKNTSLSEEYTQMSERFSYEEMVELFENSPQTLPYEYQKVWNSYQSALSMNQRNTRVKSLIRTRVITLQSEHKITTYRLCKDLHLNNSNVNAWLKNNDNNKVSIEAARAVLSYLENC